LYNKNGNPIFISSPASNDPDSEDLTARLSLRGEIFVTDGFLAGEKLAENYYLIGTIKKQDEDAIMMKELTIPVTEEWIQTL
jgi:hypothetical protein